MAASNVCHSSYWEVPFAPLRRLGGTGARGHGLSRGQMGADGGRDPWPTGAEHLLAPCSGSGWARFSWGPLLLLPWPGTGRLSGLSGEIQLRKHPGISSLRVPAKPALPCPGGEDGGGRGGCGRFTPLHPVSQGAWGLQRCLSRAAAETRAFHWGVLAAGSSPATHS